jgi:hypothetical protein
VQAISDGLGSVAEVLVAGVRSRFIFSRMRSKVLAVAFAFVLLGCESKKSTSSQTPPASGSAAGPAAPRAPLTDLTTASTLAPVRTAFNAKKGEARFLTLLSPT